MPRGEPGLGFVGKGGSHETAVDKENAPILQLQKCSLAVAGVAGPGRQIQYNGRHQAGWGLRCGCRAAHDTTQLRQVFSWLAIGPAISNFIGPFSTGLLIDHANFGGEGSTMGYRVAFGLLALVPVLAWSWVRHTQELPPVRAPIGGPKQHAWDLLRDRNFRNLLLYTPGGSKDGVKLIPVAEDAAKDDYLSIKNVSRDDQLATHRVPPQLMGVMPNNTGGFGDVTKAAQVFDINEIDSIKASLLAMNDWAGEEIIRFTSYRLSDLTVQAE